MNLSYGIPNLKLLAAIVTLLLLTALLSIAQGITYPLSGRVVGMEDNPIAGISIEIQPFVIIFILGLNFR